MKYVTILMKTVVTMRIILNSLCLDELAVEEQLVQAELYHGHRLVVEVDHTEGVVGDSPLGVGLHPRGFSPVVLGASAHTSHQPSQGPARREAEGEGLRGRRLRGRHGDAEDHHQ